MTKALIVYGTRYGAATSTSEEIAIVLRQEGLEVRVINVKEEKVRDIADYDLVVVGSGIQINRWTGEPEDFLKKFQKELARKKVALFVCCGSASQPTTNPPEVAAKAKTKYLDEKAARYHLQPVALGFFGGVYDYNKMPWWGKKAMEAERPKIAAAYKETQPGVYDTRDWNAIRSWAKELAQQVRS
jgi:menaquinone-dependent protoporphyrinogen IX oxidase